MSQFHLDSGNLAAMQAYLDGLHWLSPAERIIGAERAGEGNMNCTLRVRTTARAFILKQSRPWVEKYPHIPAPPERAVVEGAFYRAVSCEDRLASRMPRLIASDSLSYILMLEDVAPAADFTFMYGGEAPSNDECRDIAGYLATLHATFEGQSLNPQFDNVEMRRLNHEHIFDFPLRGGNGLDLDRITHGLAAEASKLQLDRRYVEGVRQLGELYLGPGPTLVHGDYFPGSWLRTGRGIKIIDPEFCFAGRPEFDLGVMIAHFEIAGIPGSETVDTYMSRRSADLKLARRVAGVEIMRRLIGVAQLPLQCGIGDKRRLLTLSRDWVLA